MLLLSAKAQYSCSSCVGSSWFCPKKEGLAVLPFGRYFRLSQTTLRLACPFSMQVGFLWAALRLNAPTTVFMPCDCLRPTSCVCACFAVQVLYATVHTDYLYFLYVSAMESFVHCPHNVPAPSPNFSHVLLSIVTLLLQSIWCS